MKEVEDKEVHKTETKNVLKSLELPATKPLKLMLNQKEKKVYAMVQRLNTLKNQRVNSSGEIVCRINRRRRRWLLREWRKKRNRRESRRRNRLK